jgi:hypothetical protein
LLYEWRICLTKSIPIINGLKKKKVIPTLTIKGFVVYCTNAITNVVEQRFDWDNALIDAAITSGVTFFSTLGGGSVAGLDTVPGIKVATVAALAQFFIFLALKRGIVQQKEAQHQ